MKKILSLFSIFYFLFSISLYAQNDADALRYSMMHYGGGTAQSIGAGGAFGAVGADFSSLSINPAGLGLYHVSSFVFTPQFSTVKSKSVFEGSTGTSNKYNLNISNFGIEGTNDLSNKGNWKSVSFGFAMNREESYHASDYYSGTDTTNSMLDYFVQQANGTSPSNLYNAQGFGAGLAYMTGLIVPAPRDTTQYYSEAFFPGAVEKSGVSSSRGAMKEYCLSIAGNYSDKIYLGMTLGIPTYSYHTTSDYTEKDKNQMYPDFNEFTLTNTLTTTGTGINIKGGIIYRVNDYCRLGLAAHSPSFVSFTDRYSASMSSKLDTSGNYTKDSPDGKYNYDLTTPWRVVASGAIIFGTHGFLSADYEFVDYSSMFFTFNNVGATGEKEQEQKINNDIKEKYTSASNIRIGGELAVDVFRIRAGWGMNGSPFKSSIAKYGSGFNSMNYSAGVGIHDKGYFIDVAYNRNMQKSFYQPYTLDNLSVPGVKQDFTRANITVTVGFKY